MTDGDLDAADRACIRIDARPLDTAEVTAEQALDRPMLPFSFGVTPPGEDSRRHVEVRVSAYRSCADAADPAVIPRVQRRLRTGFIEGQRLRAPVFLSRLCVDVVCPDEQTCDPETGGCVDIGFVDPSTLDEVTPGEELGARDGGGMSGMDGGGIDASTPVSDFARPVSPPVHEVDPTDTARFSWDVATDSSGDAFFATQNLSNAPVIRRLGADGTQRWQRAWSGLGEVRRIARIRDALYVCGEMEGQITPDGAPLLPFPATHGMGNAMFLARLDPADGAVVWARVLSRPGTDADVAMSCGDIAETATGLALAFGATPTARTIELDGVAVPTGVTRGHASPAAASGFLLYLADDGAPSVEQMRAITGVVQVYTEFTFFRLQYQISVVADRAGGLLLSALSLGPLSGIADGESLGSGTGLRYGVARYDAAGDLLWTQREARLSGDPGGHAPRVAPTTDGAVAWIQSVGVPMGETPTLSGLPGITGPTFTTGSLFAVRLSMADGTPEPASFAVATHSGAITDVAIEPSGELLVVGYALGEDEATMERPADTFGAAWSVADQDEGFVALLDGATLRTIWLLELAGPAVVEDTFVGPYEWERATGLGVGPSGETWITGKLRVADPASDVLGTTVMGLGYVSRLR